MNVYIIIIYYYYNIITARGSDGSIVFSIVKTLLTR